MNVKVNNYKIVSALLSLIQKKAYKDITIKDIIEEAKISRSSFYYYYYNAKDEVIQFAFEDLMAETTTILSQDLTFGFGVLYQLVSYLETRRELCCMLLDYIADIDHIIKEHIALILKNSDIQNKLAHLDKKFNLPQEYAWETFVVCLHFLFINWIRKPGDTSARDMANILVNFMD
ncbi:TetR/AcrR family transcriptional regulator [Streptococcus cameli]